LIKTGWNLFDLKSGNPVDAAHRRCSHNTSCFSNVRIKSHVKSVLKEPAAIFRWNVTPSTYKLHVKTAHVTVHIPIGPFLPACAFKASSFFCSSLCFCLKARSSWNYHITAIYILKIKICWNNHITAIYILKITICEKNRLENINRDSL